MTCDLGAGCNCYTATQRMFCAHFSVGERQWGNLERDSAANWMKLSQAQRMGCTEHLRAKVPPKVQAAWRKQYLKGVVIGSDDVRFHLGVGMQIRNTLRDILLDADLPGDLQWDDCYYGALESLFKGSKGAHLRASGEDQNRSDAVMAQRGTADDDDSVDDFPTPPWAGRALFEHVLPRFAFEGCTALEPACNRGFLAEVMKEYFTVPGAVFASDLLDYGYPGAHSFDFLDGTTWSPRDWTITNPPFRLAEEFFHKAWDCSRRGVALLVRLSFLETQGRFERLFSQTPPSIIAQFVERVPMVEGRFDPDASTATAYTWLVWDKQHPAQPVLYPSGLVQSPFGWVPPCRRNLTRPDDAILPLLRNHVRGSQILVDENLSVVHSRCDGEPL